MKYIASFDLSSSTVGYCIYDLEEQKLIKIDYFKYLDNSIDLLHKGKQLEDFIDSLTKEYKIELLIIEERLKKFAGGRSSINNILTLAQINYICQYQLKYKFNINVKEINVLKARGVVFPEIFTVTRKTKMKQKEYVFLKVKEILGESIFPKKIVSRGKNKGKEEFLVEGEDMADSWVILQSYLKIVLKPIPPKAKMIKEH